MRLPILFAVLLLAATQAGARECGYTTASGYRASRAAPPPEFFACLLAEIRDLKRQQREMERTLRQFERLIGELPAPYLNDNGQITADPGRRIGSATFILNPGQTSSPSALPIDQNVLEELCAPGTCEVSLHFQSFGFLSDTPIQSTIVGPCNFAFDPLTGGWTRGPGCGGSTVSGVDGDGGIGNGGTGADIIVEAERACLLADAGIRKGVGTDHAFFEKDHAIGLFLITAPARRADGVRRFKCEVRIR
ncbi:hypothetical protein FGK63_09895 [Ruegeria sediminis]|uniref:Uncharacterized protein n=1 Tax=Ruegeria sediminis TaxID=2583820 RepID=A0ABY2WY23_9RHOB|nr:hypothetical protein [Ruegeria sediminis]TMV07768.1 hypothetical protein FGK63_09895 [Ruegeria sediminis]